MADLLTSTAPAPNATSDMPQIVPADPTPDAVPVTTPMVETTVQTTSTTEQETKPSEPIAARFSQLAAQRREAEARAARLEGIVTQQSEQLREALAAIGKLTTVTTPAMSVSSASEASASTDPRPVREAYSDPEAFETALSTWVAQKTALETAATMRKQQEDLDRERAETERKNKEAANAEAERKRQEELNARQQSVWNERKAKTAEKYADYAEFAENPDLPVSIAMAHTLMDSEDGSEILYYLGKHPEESARIAAMIVPGQVFPANMGTLSGTPIPDGAAQAYELGKIAAKLGLNVEAVPMSSTVPNALASGVVPITDAISTATVSAPVLPAPLPAPPAPLSGASAVATNRDPAQMSMEEYAAMRGPQIRAQRSPGRSQLQ